jgi:hypothetical protein
MTSIEILPLDATAYEFARTATLALVSLHGLPVGFSR